MPGSGETDDDDVESATTARFTVSLPGFIAEDEPGTMGAGDLIKRGTSLLGIRPCGGCSRRAETLNRLLQIRTRRR